MVTFKDINEMTDNATSLEETGRDILFNAHASQMQKTLARMDKQQEQMRKQRERLLKYSRQFKEVKYANISEERKKQARALIKQRADRELASLKKNINKAKRTSKRAVKQSAVNAGNNALRGARTLGSRAVGAGDVAFSQTDLGALYNDVRGTYGRAKSAYQKGKRAGEIIRKARTSAGRSALAKGATKAGIKSAERLALRSIPGVGEALMLGSMFSTASMDVGKVIKAGVKTGEAVGKGATAVGKGAVKVAEAPANVVKKVQQFNDDVYIDVSKINEKADKASEYNDRLAERIEKTKEARQKKQEAFEKQLDKLEKQAEEDNEALSQLEATETSTGTTYDPNEYQTLKASIMEVNRLRVEFLDAMVKDAAQYAKSVDSQGKKIDLKDAMLAKDKSAGIQANINRFRAMISRAITRILKSRIRTDQMRKDGDSPSIRRLVAKMRLLMSDGSIGRSLGINDDESFYQSTQNDEGEAIFGGLEDFAERIISELEQF